ncbi:MAG TPA: hypothetical protein ENN03_04095 [bacterium]|nr:hypothetical protein [bacterium]
MNRLTWLVLTGLFIFLVVTLTFSDTTIDPDTVSSLLLFGRGSVTWERPVIWHVHIIYGLFLLVSRVFTSHLIAPVAFLSALSTIVFLLAGYRILKNHLSPVKAFRGMCLLAVIPGFHLLNLRLEDNLPLIAGVAVMAEALDTMSFKGVSLSRLIRTGLGFAFAILFHTIAIVFSIAPLVMLLFRWDWKKRATVLAAVYAFMLLFTAGGLALIPDGFRHFYNAYTGSYGIESSVSSVSTGVAERVQEEWTLPFRDLTTTPLDVERVASKPARRLLVTGMVFTNMFFYGWMLWGIVPVVRKWRENQVVLSMLLISLIIPIALISFTIERVDLPAYFGVIAASIGMGGMDLSSAGKRFQRYGYTGLFAVFLFWTAGVYAQCARWVYRPAEYKRYQQILGKNDFDYSVSRAMLFAEEESLIDNIDYFLFIRRYPEMIHYGIESDGKIYRIDGGWPNDKRYMDGLFDRHDRVYASSKAVSRWRQYYPEAEGFIILEE